MLVYTNDNISSTCPYHWWPIHLSVGVTLHANTVTCSRTRWPRSLCMYKSSNIQTTILRIRPKQKVSQFIQTIKSNPSLCPKNPNQCRALLMEMVRIRKVYTANAIGWPLSGVTIALSVQFRISWSFNFRPIHASLVHNNSMLLNATQCGSLRGCP